MGRRTCSACEMTPISDIEKLERLLAEATPGTLEVFQCNSKMWNTTVAYVVALCNIAPSLIADWKQMRGEIERLTKELDEAYERVAHVCDISVEQITALDPSSPRINEAQAIAAVIRNLKAKEPKP